MDRSRRPPTRQVVLLALMQAPLICAPDHIGRVFLADSITLVADCLTVATLPGEQQAMAGVLSEIFSFTLNGLVSAALVLAAVAEMGQRYL
jgi:hypothetical protein